MQTMGVDASGAHFGCGALATPVTLKKDACPDVNNCPVGEWTADGAVGAFDTIALIYTASNRTLAGLGANCHGAWILYGRVNKKLVKFKGKSVTATSSGKAK